MIDTEIQLFDEERLGEFAESGGCRQNRDNGRKDEEGNI